MFGSHLSIAGSMVNALKEAERLGFETVQVFTKNQQQWRVPPLDPAQVKDWQAEVARLGWGGRTVAHASYLINLASPDDVLWEKSVALMREEIERCEVLGIPYLVHHPGAYTSSNAEAGIARIAEAYRRLFAGTRGYATVSCLENTVGSGSNLGGQFEQLAAIRAAIVDATGQPNRVGYCFDTCHAHAAGYSMAARADAEAVLDRFDALCGLGNLRVVHVNDSKGGAASKRDLHAHIGEGTIGKPTVGRSGFAAVVNRSALSRVPKILETPKGENGAGVAFDVINVRRLRRLMARPGEPIMEGPTRRSRPATSRTGYTPPKRRTRRS